MTRYSFSRVQRRFSVPIPGHIGCLRLSLQSFFSKYAEGKKRYPPYRFNSKKKTLRDPLVGILDIVGTINLAIHMTLKLTEPRAHC